MLYLGATGWRSCLGTTVFRVRFLALADAVSLVTGGLLAGRCCHGARRAGRPGAADLRCPVLSRWGWNMIVLVPRRRRDAASRADLAPGGASPAAFPADGRRPGACLPWRGSGRWAAFALVLRRRRRADFAGRRFSLPWAAAAAVLFSTARGRPFSCFARPAGRNLALELARAGSAMRGASAAADALAAPWWVPDPSPRHDLPGAARLGFLLGVPVSVALARSLLRPRAGLSALPLCQAGASTVAGGAAGIERVALRNPHHRDGHGPQPARSRFGSAGAPAPRGGI